MTSCDYDPNAGAVVLGKTTDVNYVITKDVIQVQYDVKGRVKILNSEGAARHSSLDIVGTINDQSDYTRTRNYWKYLKGKLRKQGSEVVSVTNQLKLLAPDGKRRLTDVLDYEGVMQ